MGSAPASRTHAASAAATAAITVPPAVILRHDHIRRPFAPRSATRTARGRTSNSSRVGRAIAKDRVALRVEGRGRRRGTAVAAVLVLILVSVSVGAVEAAVDRALVLAGGAVLAEAGGSAVVAALHEPYGVLDELHWRAEDLVLPGAVEVGVGARVRGVRFVACEVDPERVALWETDELPGDPKRRRWS